MAAPALWKYQVLLGTCNSSRRSLFREVDRGLQAGAVDLDLVVDFVTIVAAYCSDNNARTVVMSPMLFMKLSQPPSKKVSPMIRC